MAELSDLQEVFCTKARRRKSQAAIMAIYCTKTWDFASSPKDMGESDGSSEQRNFAGNGRCQMIADK